MAENRVSMVVFSGDLDKVLAAFVIASGAAAMGMEVSMFFTFWGLSALKKGRRLRGKKPFEQAFALMAPGATTSLGLSQMNFGGVGAKLMRKMMRDKQIASLEDLAAKARELGVRTVACQMGMEGSAAALPGLGEGGQEPGAGGTGADRAGRQVRLRPPSDPRPAGPASRRGRASGSDLVESCKLGFD